MDKIVYYHYLDRFGGHRVLNKLQKHYRYRLKRKPKSKGVYFVVTVDLGAVPIFTFTLRGWVVGVVGVVCGFCCSRYRTGKTV